jgi:enamine deaminase RidA (YjgF/YER057c/UK114 family)
MAERDAVFPANPHALYAEHRYSPAIRANGLLFVSGQVGARADGSPEPDTEAQMRLAFENLLGVLKAAGCTFDDVVDTTLYLVDPEGDFETLLKVMPDYWGEAPYPALTGVGVNWLAGFRFEIKVIARLPDGAQA